MVISYVEDIVSEFYRLQGYLITRDRAYKPDTPRQGKKQTGWKDIDVLAYNEDEVLIIECKSFTGDRSSDKMVDSLLKSFEDAQQEVKTIPLLQEKPIRRLLVVDYPILKTNDRLKEQGVEIHLLKDIMTDFIRKLEGRIKDNRLGREHHPTTRLILFLLQNGFIKT
ncbi:MAG: hypothetical protein ACTSW4_05280 [Candidatus Ranarchaeia archaeon]